MNDPPEVNGIESSAEPLTSPESRSSSDATALSSASSSGSAFRLKGRSSSSSEEQIEVVTLPAVSGPGDVLRVLVARSVSVPLQLGPTRSSGLTAGALASTARGTGLGWSAKAGCSEGGGGDMVPEGDVGLRSPGGSNGGKCLSKCSGTGCGFIRTCGYFARCL